jgi:hypothetical protein
MISLKKGKGIMMKWIDIPNQDFSFSPHWFATVKCLSLIMYKLEDLEDRLTVLEIRRTLISYLEPTFHST